MNNLLRNSITARETLPIGDKNGEPSMTTPDQCLSIKQLIERHVSGINMGAQEKEPLYFDEDLPNFEFMDIEELAQYRQQLSDERYRLEEELKTRRKAEQDYLAQSRNGTPPLSGGKELSTTTPTATEILP